MRYLRRGLLDPCHHGACCDDAAVRTNHGVLVLELIRILRHQRERPTVNVLVFAFFKTALSSVGFELDHATLGRDQFRYRPVSKLVSAEGGVIKFKTDAAESGLEEGKDEYVDSWSLSLMPEDANQFKYEYTVIRPDRSIITASAMVTRVE